MSLSDGAETISNQCLNIKEEEKVLVLNDGNDQDLIDSIIEILEEEGCSFELLEYPESERSGVEPPKEVAEEMKQADVFIAPTKKSLSHTDARRNASEAGVRGATLPGINKEVWNTSLQADYNEVKSISEKVYEMLKETSKVRIKTPSGTDLTLDVDINYYEQDTGLIHRDGEFGNLPAGEADGGAINAEGTLVIDHLPMAPNSEDAEVEIKDNKAVAVESERSNKLEEAFSDIEGARNVAEFGFGTNPEAVLIGNVLQDEKVLGTVHIAFGDNSSYMPEGDERRVNCDIHWDTVCENPTVWFDDEKVLDDGEPVFLD